MTPLPHPVHHRTLRNFRYGKSRVLALVVALAGMLLVKVIPEGTSRHLAHAQSADSSLDFVENGMAPVAAFLAYDLAVTGNGGCQRPADEAAGAGNQHGAHRSGAPVQSMTTPTMPWRSPLLRRENISGASV